MRIVRLLPKIQSTNRFLDDFRLRELTPTILAIVAKLDGFPPSNLRNICVYDREVRDAGCGDRASLYVAVLYWNVACRTHNWHGFRP